MAECAILAAQPAVYHFSLTTMASLSEKTFGKRHTQGVALYDRVKGENDYAPQENALITKAALAAHLAEILDRTSLRQRRFGAA